MGWKISSWNEAQAVTLNMNGMKNTSRRPWGFRLDPYLNGGQNVSTKWETQDGTFRYLHRKWGVCKEGWKYGYLKALKKGQILGISLLRLNSFGKKRRNHDGTFGFCTINPRGVCKRKKMGVPKAWKGVDLGRLIAETEWLLKQMTFCKNNSGLTLTLNENCLWWDSGEHREVCESESPGAQIKTRREGSWKLLLSSPKEG